MKHGYFRKKGKYTKKKQKTKKEKQNKDYKKKNKRKKNKGKIIKNKQTNKETNMLISITILNNHIPKHCKRLGAGC